MGLYLLFIPYRLDYLGATTIRIKEMIRKIIRRLTIFPLMVIGSPMIYFIVWCFDGHEEAICHVKDILLDIWGD